VTFVSVPLILLGMLLHLLRWFGSAIWFAADKSLAVVLVTDAFADGWQNVDQRWQYITALAAIIGWRFRAWKTPAFVSAGSADFLANGDDGAAYAGCGAGAGDGH
jgi:competence protein ComEC